MGLNWQLWRKKMENENLKNYLQRLIDLDKQLSDDSDADEIISEVNKVINGLSRDMQLDITKRSSPTLKFINKSNNADPSFAHKGDSGFDLRAFLEGEIEYNIDPGNIVMVPTGLYFEVEKGLEIQIRSRSGLAAKNNCMVLNSPGTIDSHYRGQVIIIFANFGTEKVIIKNGDRIAQGVVCPVYGEGILDIIKVKKLSDTIRSDNGFGSTGTI
jgi:dUTP pyrophosphatase